MPNFAEKTSEYPFGYGYCQCGCGKTTKVVGGVHLKFFNRLHNPDADAWRINWIKQLGATRKETETALLGDGFLSDPTRPALRQPTTEVISSSQTDARLTQSVAWTKANQDFVRWHRKKLRARVNEWQKRYQQERRKRDPTFKLVAYVRGRIHGALKRKSIRKSAKTEQLLGCSLQELRNHLEAKFKDGMTWDNYGKWHVDHIKPCRDFDLTKPEGQKACFHYTNLQPLWAEENYKKSGRSLCKAPAAGEPTASEEHSKLDQSTNAPAGK